MEQVRSLRAEIEAAHLNCQILEKKYREATSKDEQMDVVGLKEMLQRAEEALELKEVEIKQLKYDFRDSAGQIAVLREKVKEL